jgi:hypothetical protein
VIHYHGSYLVCSNGLCSIRAISSALEECPNGVAITPSVHPSQSYYDPVCASQPELLLPHMLEDWAPQPRLPRVFDWPGLPK